MYVNDLMAEFVKVKGPFTWRNYNFKNSFAHNNFLTTSKRIQTHDPDFYGSVGRQFIYNVDDW
jgi:hypothetical protein